MDKRAELIKKMQEEMDRRTKIENEAIQLMCEGKFEQATDLLSSIDDSIIREISEELDKLDATLEGKDADKMTRIRSHKKKSTHITVLVDGSLGDYEKICKKIRNEVRKHNHISDNDISYNIMTTGYK